MGKIATVEKATHILTGTSNPIKRCVTKKYLVDNFNNVDTSKLTVYSDSKLVSESDITVKPIPIEYSIPLTTNFIDSLGNSYVEKDLADISSGACKFGNEYSCGYIIYNLPDFSSISEITLSYDFMITNYTRHIFISNDNSGDPGSSNNSWMNIYADGNGEYKLKWAYRGGYITSSRLNLNTWHNIEITYNYITSTGTLKLDNELKLTSNMDNTRPDTIRFGLSYNGMYGYIKNVSIITS